MEAPESMKGKPVKCPSCQRIHAVGAAGGAGVGGGVGGGGGRVGEGVGDGGGGVGGVGENPIPQLAQPAQHIPFGKQDEKRIRRMITDSVCAGVVRGGIWLFVIYVLFRFALFAIGTSFGIGSSPLQE